MTEEVEQLRAEVIALRKRVEELEARAPMVIEHRYYPPTFAPQYPLYPSQPYWGPHWTWSSTSGGAIGMAQ